MLVGVWLVGLVGSKQQLHAPRTPADATSPLHLPVHSFEGHNTQRLVSQAPGSEYPGMPCSWLPRLYLQVESASHTGHVRACLFSVAAAAPASAI